MMCGVAVGQSAPDRGPIFATSGWFTLAVSASDEAGRHQTALRGRARSPIREADCRRHQRRLRNLSVPTNRSSKTASSTPFGLTASGGNAPRESRPACGRGGLPPAASAQFVCTRSSGRIGRAILACLQGVDDPVTGPGANPIVVGSGVCRSATREVEPQKSVAIDRGRRCCPSSACSSPDRAGVSRGRRSGPVHVFSFEAVLVLCV
jgi:hypothetical protein